MAIATTSGAKRTDPTIPASDPRFKWTAGADVQSTWRRHGWTPPSEKRTRGMGELQRRRDACWPKPTPRRPSKLDWSQAPYTSPPAQRTWVGLTPKEIDDLYCEHHDDYGYKLSATGYERAIEAKLKEKNT